MAPGENSTLWNHVIHHTGDELAFHSACPGLQNCSSLSSKVTQQMSFTPKVCQQRSSYGWGRGIPNHHDDAWCALVGGISQPSFHHRWKCFVELNANFTSIPLGVSNTVSSWNWTIREVSTWATLLWWLFEITSHELCRIVSDWF